LTNCRNKCTFTYCSQENNAGFCMQRSTTTDPTCTNKCVSKCFA
jgi:hypothetical protein